MQMRRTLPYMAALAAAALVGCAGTPTLYNWGPYEQQVYAHFKNESPVRQIELLEKHAQETQAKGKQLPPGYRAHLGLLYEKVGRGPDFVSALEQEKSGFPRVCQLYRQAAGAAQSQACCTCFGNSFCNQICTSSRSGGIGSKACSGGEKMKKTSVMALCLLAFALGGCATNTVQIAKKDYSAYRAADPKTILILPPKNTSPDVAASYGFYSNTQAPVAESGYYVLPITLVDEQFKSNGLTVVDDIHQVDFRKLREVFGADAALYITVTDYGTRYLVIDSVTTVTAQARLVDLKTGRELWAGRASANSNEGGGNSGGGLIGMLVSAALSQIVNSVGDAGHGMAKVTAGRLLSAGGSHSMLPGPRSPAYQNQKVQPATAAVPVAP